MPMLPVILINTLIGAFCVLIVTAPLFIWHHCAHLHKLAKASAEREARATAAQVRAAEAMAEAAAEMERVRALVAQVALNQERYAQLVTEDDGHVAGYNEAVPVASMTAKKSHANRAVFVPKH